MKTENYPYQSSAYDPFILGRIENLLETYVNKHSKVLTVRFDIRYPQSYPAVTTNEDIQHCIAKIIKKYKRQGLDPYYCWVREQNTSLHPHYHVAILLNGNKVRSYSHVFETTEQFWQSTLGTDVTGCIDHCLGNGSHQDFYNGKIIRRTDVDFDLQYQETTNQLSYLAKNHTKQYEKDNLRNFGMSRL